MNNKCDFPRCGQPAVARADGVRNRRVTERWFYCPEHVPAFWATYDAKRRIGHGPNYNGEGVAFDVELLLYDDRPGKFCCVTLREVGGGRRLDCGISPFDAAALWWQIEPFKHDRPLTHPAMAATITALGGRLESVIIDRFLPSQKVAFEAKLQIRQMNIQHIVDVRLIDAVVLGVVCKAPILVADSVLAKLPKNDPPFA